MTAECERDEETHTHRHQNFKSVLCVCVTHVLLRSYTLVHISASRNTKRMNETHGTRAQSLLKKEKQRKEEVSPVFGCSSVAYRLWKV
jgi:hypothetical protein